MYTLLLSSVLLTQCPSPLIPFHSITDLLSVHLLLIHSFSQLFVEREWCYLYVICFVPTVCIMKVLVIWQFVIPKVVEVWKWREGEWMQSFCLYLLAIGGVPRLCILLHPSFPFFFDLQSSLPLKCIGDFIVTKSYISLCFLIFLVTYTTCDTRICLRRRERISIDFFDFFNWLMVGSVAWLHVVSVHPIIYDQCLLFFVSWHSVRMLLQFYSFAHFFSLFYSFAFDVFDRWRVECRLSLWMSLLIFPFY